MIMNREGGPGGSHHCYVTLKCCVGIYVYVQSLMEIVVRSYKNLIRNTVSYKIRSFLNIQDSKFL